MPFDLRPRLTASVESLPNELDKKVSFENQLETLLVFMPSKEKRLFAGFA